jgi:hypothetical protein
MDGADSTTISITALKVSGWNDKSGRNFHFSQSTAAYRPTYTNGAIIFTYSSSNYLYGNALATNFTVGTNSYACFVVCSISTLGMTSTTSTIYCKAPFVGSSGRIFISRNQSAGNQSYLNARFAKDGTAEYGVLENTPVTYRIIELIVNRKVSNADYIYTTGNLIRTTTYSPDTTNYTNAYTMLIGGMNGSASGTDGTTASGYFLDGKVAEIVSYSNTTDMTDPQREKIEGYLAWKWGIQSSLPGGHRYINGPP